MNILRNVRFYLALGLTLLPHPLSAEDLQTSVGKTLDGFHQAASEAQFEKYFSYFAPEGIFLGTDASERWTVKEFRAYVAPHFAKGKGWTYTAHDRFVSFNAAKDTAWFDEKLDSASYGEARGSGVLVYSQDSKAWKIAQYNLTFPIPNGLAKKFTDEIKSLNAKPNPMPAPQTK